MHDAATAMTWAAAVLGAGSLIYSLVCLLSRNGLSRNGLSRNGGARTRPALGRFWMAVFVLVETGPRLAGWPSEVVLALSVLAFVPLLLAGRLLARPR